MCRKRKMCDPLGQVERAPGIAYMLKNFLKSRRNPQRHSEEATNGSLRDIV